MGFYDQLNAKKTRRMTVKAAVFGGIIGALTAGLLLFYGLNLAGADEKKHTSSQSQEVVEEVEVYQTNISTAITDSIEKVSGAVVGVTNIKGDVLFSPEQVAGNGSGVIYKKEGDKAYVVTNNHVIDGANQIEVTLSDGTKVQAKLLGSDVLTDLAVLEIDAKHVTQVAKLGNSDHLSLGEPVIAIGNPLGQRFSGSVTQGIISGLNRSIPVDLNRDGEADWQADVIQTDAAINPGNSGGALVNIKGEVIGINSMKIAQAAVEGIGLAIPTTVAKPVIKDLEQYHEVRRPFMGVGLKSLSTIPSYHLQDTLKLPAEVKSGVAVISVVPDSPAAKGGLQKLDVIVALDGEKIETDMDIRKYLYQNKQVGDKMEITFYRNGEKQTTEVKLVEIGK